MLGTSGPRRADARSGHPGRRAAARPAAATAMRPWQEILLNRRMLVCVFQGLSSGIPLYVLIQLVPGWLRTEQVDLSTIGLFSLVTLPYTWKFVWSPVVDRFRMPFLTRRRGWMIATQVLLLASISQFGAIDPLQNIYAVAWLMFATSLFSATQDIVLDAYRRELLADDELGTGNSIFVNAYRISSLIPGSLAFVLSDHLPWGAVFWVVAASMAIGIVTTVLVGEAADERIAPRSMREAVVEPFREFFGRDGFRSGLLLLAFIVLYKLGDNMAVALQTPFFLDMGFSRTEIGTIAKLSILGSSILGTALAGVVMLKVPINRALWLFGVAQMVAILGYAGLAKIGHNLFALFAAASFEYVGMSLGAVALTAFMAQQTDVRFTATQFALLSSLASVPRTFANATTGFIIDAVGYFNFFLICTLLAIPGLVLLAFIAPWNGERAAGRDCMIRERTSGPA
ncbi:MAG TPA: AmpG family muropeptide MFS transporter [Gammaproteobacteria bacterium]|nr:AmpG family muropeptide MFS transporter [Gammaproteobacteria bacterium]